MSTCVLCKQPIVNGEFMIDGRPAVCGWVPPGAGKSVYAIVTAHLHCMGVLQLQQFLTDSEDDTKRRGYPAAIVPEAERRLSELLAVGDRGGVAPPTGSRFENLELD